MKASYTENKPEKFEDAVTKSGYGLYNLYLLLIGGGSLMSVIIETMGMMFVLPAASNELNLTLAEKGTLASISFAGVVLSSHLWGFLADTRGRRKILIASLTMAELFSLLSSISSSPNQFILFRFFNGFFIGGASAVIYAYVGEFHNQRFRPKVVAWIATFVALGNIALPALSWIILPMDGFEIFGFEFKPWRLLVIAFGVPTLIFTVGLVFLPESPKFLLTQGYRKEALDVLRRMYVVNTRNPQQSYPVSDIIWDEIEEVKYNKEGLLVTIWAQTAPLFKSPYLLKSLMLCFLQFGVFATSSGLFMWYPTIINAMESSPSNGKMCVAIENSDHRKDTVDDTVYHASLMIGGALVILYITFGIIINRVGTKNLLVITLILTTLCGITVPYVTGNLWVKLLIGVFLLTSSCVGIINTIVVEVYPTQLRGMALAMSLMFGRLGAFAGAHATGFLVYNFCEYAFYAFAADHFLLVLIIILLPTGKKVTRMLEPIT